MTLIPDSVLFMQPGADWAGHALKALSAAGYRSGEARSRVIELLGNQSCALTPLEIDRKLDQVGRASVYRALEQLEDLALVQRVDLGSGTAGYERRDPGGEHHHHIVCERCGAVTPFTDPGLERAIHSVSAGSGFEISAHEIVLRGACASCSGAGTSKA